MNKFRICLCALARIDQEMSDLVKMASVLDLDFKQSD